MSDAIRILLVEDNLLARVGTATLLATQPDFSVVAEADNGARGLDAFRSTGADVVVVDLRMPELDGVGLIEALAREPAPPRVLVLTHYDGEEMVFRALRAGALGYLTKDTDGAALFDAVRAVARGERYVPAAIADRLRSRSDAAPLSPREQQTLRHIFAGRSNKEIASELGLSVKTVGMFVARLYAKLGVNSRAEAIAVALKKGLIEP